MRYPIDEKTNKPYGIPGEEKVVEIEQPKVQDEPIKIKKRK